MTVRLALVCWALAGLIACGGGEKPEDIAREVAEEWTAQSIDLVSREAAQLVLGEIPLATGLAAGAIAGQIRDGLEWSYETPSRQSDRVYSVTAMAATTIRIDLPLLDPRSYTASVPFTLNVDIEDRTVTSWNVRTPSVVSADS